MMNVVLHSGVIGLCKKALPRRVRGFKEGFTYFMKLRLILVALIPLLLSTWSLASVREVPIEEIKSSREQRQATLIILKVIDKYHYKTVSYICIH